jgi:hypothetical protein
MPGQIGYGNGSVSDKYIPDKKSADQVPGILEKHTG